jgi:hypothetical protein
MRDWSAISHAVVYVVLTVELICFGFHKTDAARGRDAPQVLPLPGTGLRRKTSAMIRVPRLPNKVMVLT